MHLQLQGVSLPSFHPWLLGFIFTGLSVAGQVYAQDPVIAGTRQLQLHELAATLRQRDANDRGLAEAFARHAGIPLRRSLPNGGILELQRIAPGIGPVFYITNNILAAQTVSTDEVWPGGAAGLSLDGTGMTMAEWDGGAVDAGHPEFTGRVTQADDAATVSEHATHVAGTLIAAGFLFEDLRGMAYAANLDAYDWNFDTAEMATAAANGQLVSNHLRHRGRLDLYRRVAAAGYLVVDRRCRPRDPGRSEFRLLRQ